MELFGEFEGLIYERRNSSQIWEPFCKLEDIIYEEKIYENSLKIMEQFCEFRYLISEERKKEGLNWH